MKKQLLLLTTVLIAFTAAAQTDFSGSWKLNPSKSTLNSEHSMAPKEIIIEQDETNFKVEKQFTFQGSDFNVTDKFTLDGKECINSGWNNTEKKSTAQWDDHKKSLKITSTLPMQNGEEMSFNETFQLNGADLVLETHASSSYGEMSEKMVYEKQ